MVRDTLELRVGVLLGAMTGCRVQGLGLRGEGCSMVGLSDSGCLTDRRKNPHASSLSSTAGAAAARLGRCVRRVPGLREATVWPDLRPEFILM